MRIPLEQQREVYDRFGAEAGRVLVEQLGSRIEELVRLGAERAFSEVGIHEYGDATYWTSPEQLEQELDAELADAVFYLHIRLARAAGALPTPED
jgi:hypothetical protein